MGLEAVTFSPATDSLGELGLVVTVARAAASSAVASELARDLASAGRASVLFAELRLEVDTVSPLAATVEPGRRPASSAGAAFFTCGADDVAFSSCTVGVEALPVDFSESSGWVLSATSGAAGPEPALSLSSGRAAVAATEGVATALASAVSCAPVTRVGVAGCRSASEPASSVAAISAGCFPAAFLLAGAFLVGRAGLDGSETRPALFAGAAFAAAFDPDAVPARVLWVAASAGAPCVGASAGVLSVVSVVEVGSSDERSAGAGEFSGREVWAVGVTVAAAWVGVGAAFVGDGLGADGLRGAEAGVFLAGAAFLGGRVGLFAGGVLSPASAGEGSGVRCLRGGALRGGAGESVPPWG
ncbi:hypothetical protein OWR29_25775 [Actinoplanes sp. Pm04-4]|uniref:Uncharacterized protein n=1 Tax=Paractinoplanes pyxinae TaxID=2997416 RepID=A0ABT4B4K5_9ACTN|nr:hypothetical protein [Actinoplanes pyxinae]MCY1141422.1 hypothetical protein [Actinoplanes pyxinae]